ncbi:glycosyltransferase family 2 protein [Euzebya tangerina]|uniref:glycosyltransferase family 2 protein n=1 Tax=Euzebya tangerina TaxID=591198 RepID=UPI000E311371|nr:glycosyltransferase family 2 protein [Euzebya tangerina]
MRSGSADVAPELRRSPVRVTAVLTVHNRKPLTVRCLDALAAQRLEGAVLDVVLFDDGSTDGTSEAVLAQHPGTTVLRGDGSFFWNGGMRVALAHAMAARPDFLLWMNDDTVVEPDAVARLLAVHRSLSKRGQPGLVSATVVDPDTGEVNYTGRRQDRWRPMAFHPVVADARPEPADTMNGNCVLVPRVVFEAVGNLERTFQHSMGDYDYGLRARRAGFGVWVAPGVLGTCPSNPGFVPSKDEDVRAAFGRLRDTKHLPPGEWLTFVRRWGGPLWPLFWAFPYLRRLGWIVRSRIGG